MNPARTTLLGAGTLLLVAAGYVVYSRFTEPSGVARTRASASATNPVVAPSPRTGDDLPRDPSSRFDALRGLLTSSDTERIKVAQRDSENAPLFARLAAESDDPALVLAALDGLQGTYASRPSKKKAFPDEGFERAILKNLDAKEPALGARALGVVPIALMTKSPSANLTSNLVKMAGSEEPAARRYASLQALSTLRPDTRNEAVLSAFIGALAGPEPHLIAVALQALEGSGPSLLAAPAELRGKLPSVLLLVEHRDAGVRGRALAFFAELSWVVDDTLRCRAALGHLKDTDPYVRAQAADLLGRAGRLSAVPSLLALVGDLAGTRYVLRGFDTLDGTPGELSQKVSGRPRVADAALHALRSLSTLVPGVPPLELSLGGPAQTEADVAESATRVRAWYERAKGLIPAER